MELSDKVRDLLDELGADDYEESDEWKGYKVFKPVYDGEPIIGLPLVVLENEGGARISTPDESLEYLGYVLEQSGELTEE